MSDDQWIVIVGWEKFQHYSNRDITWIKDYLDQLDRDAYLELSLALRGLLLDLRKLYARRNGVLRGDHLNISRALNVRVTGKQLEALVNAGFIEVSASKPLALTRARALAKRSTSYSKEGASAPPSPNGDVALAPEEEEPLRDPDAVTRAKALIHEVFDK